MPGEWVEAGDRVDLVSEKFEPHRFLVGGCRINLDHVPAHPKFSPHEIHIVAPVLQGHQVGHQPALLYLIAAWALVTGAFEIAAAIRLRKVITGEWILALSGILSIALGVLLIVAPGPGALAVVIWIGAYAFVFGALLFALGLRLKGLGSPRHRGQPAPGVA